MNSDRSGRLISGLIYGLIAGLCIGLIDIIRLRIKGTGRNIDVRRTLKLLKSTSNITFIVLLTGLILVVILRSKNLDFNYPIFVPDKIAHQSNELILGPTLSNKKFAFNHPAFASEKHSHPSVGAPGAVDWVIARVKKVRSFVRSLLGIGGILSLIVGLIWGLIFGLRNTSRSIADDIRTIEILNLSWTRALKGAAWGLFVGSYFWLIFVADVESNRASIVFFPLLLSAGLVGALFGGISNKIEAVRTSFNHGIRLSIRNAVIIGLIWGTIFALLWIIIWTLLWRQILGIDVNEIDALTLGLVFWLNAGLLAALWHGGLDVIQHYTLRLILSCNGYAPWNYVRFLDYAADRILLQKVGGGYIFIHRLLMEHFATMPLQGKIQKN